MLLIFVSLALTSYSARAGDGSTVDWLLDMNDTTCKEPNTEVWITMDKPAHLKWIRIILDNVPDTHEGMTGVCTYLDEKLSPRPGDI